MASIMKKVNSKGSGKILKSWAVAEVTDKWVILHKKDGPKWAIYYKGNNPRKAVPCRLLIPKKKKMS